MKSIIGIYDLRTQRAETLLSMGGHLEAPNWAPNGEFLVVNKGGKLFSLPLAAPELHPIDSGFAHKINNDHGISPDGSLLVISDSSEEGRSCLYSMPISGGTPQRITAHVPSYWHGWSPDGQTLTYTALRAETYQIFTCPLIGGEETQITQGFDHCDGPDYSADGQWIWFNGEINGSVQLWRVRTDSSDRQQMTHDGRVNWFPHPSPDGKHVLYLAYASGTKGHPSNQAVELRLMPAEGGEPQVLLELHGGQGTINVPCWANDSQRFAFVSYAETESPASATGS